MATQASSKQTSLMLGNDSDETKLVLKTFKSRRDEQGLESNFEQTKIFPMTTQADRSGWLKVCGNSKTKAGPKPKQLVTCKHDKRSHVSEIPPAKPSTYMDTLPSIQGHIWGLADVIRTLLLLWICIAFPPRVPSRIHPPAVNYVLNLLTSNYARPLNLAPCGT